MPSDAAQCVRAQLLALAATAAELSKCISTAQTFLSELRAARTKYDQLAMLDASGHSMKQLSATVNSQADPLFGAASDGATLIKIGAQHLRLLDTLADAAQGAFTVLEHDLEQLACAVADDSALTIAASALHIETTAGVTTCASWVRLSASLAQQLTTECELMQTRLVDLADCRTLALSAMLRAKRQAMLVK